MAASKNNEGDDMNLKLNGQDPVQTSVNIQMFQPENVMTHSITNISSSANDLVVASEGNPVSYKKDEFLC